MEAYSNIGEVANWFIAHDQNITPKKLQKLLYYAYAWSLVFFNEDVTELDNRLFQADFQAWVHGPVNPSIYEKYKHFGYNVITRPNHAADVLVGNPDLLDLLEQVESVYGQYDGNSLERLTHSEAPWQKARGNARPLDSSNALISDVDMYNYYGQLLGD
ncbi:DUF4065 domain-containing protein [Lactiplantibacillus garii]|uniref:DUF4065 domain-containing protein n=1 Tax=Lactiplantibacillus garii TaxID=2306423 RepID=A0A3R8KDI6_9LACO|nr:type II toxin-antitoxin system antitoxin SocA domain-containing protein [Lactiplantibacillus garii]RRK09780.1 DUF4065 domain-containing protein [Lactiplantibacillus garii]